MSLGDRIKNIRKEVGYTQADLREKANISKGYLSEIENDKQEPSLKVLRRIAKALGISTSYLLSEFENYENKIDGYKEFEIIPVLGSIAAGQPVFAEENIKEYAKVPSEKVCDGQYFYLEVSGDSMIGAGIHEGDLVLVKKQNDVNHKDIAVVMVNAHDATLKRVFKQNGSVILQPENKKYDPIMIKSKDARIVGKVVGLTRSF